MSEDKNSKICILGAGISGFSAAYYLMKKGYKNITILERENRVGGKCYSIRYKGKIYEMGAMMGAPSYYNINKLMSEFGIENDGPQLYRDFFDIYGNRISQVPTEEISELKKQFSKLKKILRKYNQLKNPGLTNLPKDLCIMFKEWCSRYNIDLVTKIYAPPFTSFGYGYLDEIPAAYVLKFLDLKTLSAFIGITHLLTLSKGLQELCQIIADEIDDLRLDVHIQSITRDNRIVIETQYGIDEFDNLIITSPLDETIEFMDVSEKEEELFSKIEYNYFNVFAYSVDNLPKVSGYIPYNFSKSRIGHVMVWYYRWQDSASNDLVTFYTLSEKNTPVKICKEIVEEDLKNLGVKVNNLILHKRWKYFPHFSKSELLSGYYDKLDKLQSKKNTFYAGEIMSFSNIEQCSIYSKYIVEKYF